MRIDSTSFYEFWRANERKPDFEALCRMSDPPRLVVEILAEECLIWLQRIADRSMRP